jgi:hypothetical protein
VLLPVPVVLGLTAVVEEEVVLPTKDSKQEIVILMAAIAKANVYRTLAVNVSPKLDTVNAVVTLMIVNELVGHTIRANILVVRMLL